MRVSRPLSPSAHVDTFSRDRLPPEDQWPELRFDRPELEYPDRLNCAHRLIDDAIERLGPDRRCLVTATTEWSYGELHDRANQVANLLTGEFGLLPGNRVLLRAPNNPWLVATWLGVLQAGGVAVLTMPLLRATELVTTIELTEPNLAICDHRFVDELHAARGTANPRLTIVTYGGTEPDDLVARASAEAVEYSPVQTAADDVALLALTSGTTGRPKVTMHFHRDVLAIADTFSRHVLRPEPSDLFTTTAPFAFTFGLGAGLVFPLHAAAATLLLERATPDELADAVVRARSNGSLDGTYGLQGNGRRRTGGGAAGPTPGGLGRRAPAGDHLAGVLRGHRCADHRRHRIHRDAAHLHRRCRREHPARLDRPRGAGLSRNRSRRPRQ